MPPLESRVARLQSISQLSTRLSRSQSHSHSHFRPQQTPSPPHQPRRRHLTTRVTPPSRPLPTPTLTPTPTQPSRWSRWQQSVRYAGGGGGGGGGGSTFTGRLRALQRSNPVALPSAIIAMLAAGGALVAVSWVYMTYFVPIDTTFPAPVALKLKRALYYSSQDVQPSKAWDYYKQALQAAEEQGLHPFSDEVLGIKFSAAGMLERTNNFRQAIQVLDTVRADCLRFVEWAEAQTQEGADLRKSRTRVLGKAVGTCVKLGSLQSNPYVNDLAAAEHSLTQGVELALREQHRRAVNDVKDDEEGEWLSSEELGGTLESLADHYESISKHALAAPLYLRAITLSQPSSCHTAVLMNNLATSLAQTLPESATSLAGAGAGGNSSSPMSAPPTSRSALISNAKSWTEKALQVCQTQRPQEGSEECDLACAVATHNLGEFAEMEGLVDEARRRYEEARRLAKGMGFVEGMKNADEGLTRLAAAGGSGGGDSVIRR